VPDIIIATDATSVYREVASVLDAPGTTLRWVRSGHDVRPEQDRQPADLVVTDLQIGSMGGVAVVLDLHLEIDAGRLLAVPTLLLLDRRADVFLARRAGVDGWVLRPLDPIRLRRAASTLLSGGTWYDDTDLPDPVALPAS
jgi:DNA-binding response OmpR family regulator